MKTWYGVWVLYTMYMNISVDGVYMYMYVCQIYVHVYNFGEVCVVLTSSGPCWHRSQLFITIRSSYSSHQIPHCTVEVIWQIMDGIFTSLIINHVLNQYQLPLHFENNGFNQLFQWQCSGFTFSFHMGIEETPSLPHEIHPSLFWKTDGTSFLVTAMFLFGVGIPSHINIIVNYNRFIVDNNDIRYWQPNSRFLVSVSAVIALVCMSLHIFYFCTSFRRRSYVRFWQSRVIRHNYGIWIYINKPGRLYIRNHLIKKIIRLLWSGRLFTTSLVLKRVTDIRAGLRCRVILMAALCCCKAWHHLVNENGMKLFQDDCHVCARVLSWVIIRRLGAEHCFRTVFPTLYRSHIRNTFRVWDGFLVGNGVSILIVLFCAIYFLLNARRSHTFWVAEW